MEKDSVAFPPHLSPPLLTPSPLVLSFIHHYMRSFTYHLHVHFHNNAGVLELQMCVQPMRPVVDSVRQRQQTVFFSSHTKKRKSACFFPAQRMNVAALCFASVVLSLTHVIACGVQPTNLCPLNEFLHGKTRQEKREGAISRKMTEKELLLIAGKRVSGTCC